MVNPLQIALGILIDVEKFSYRVVWQIASAWEEIISVKKYSLSALLYNKSLSVSVGRIAKDGMAFFTELSCRALNFAVGSNCDFFIGKLFANSCSLALDTASTLSPKTKGHWSTSSASAGLVNIIQVTRRILKRFNDMKLFTKTSILLVTSKYCGHISLH